MQVAHSHFIAFTGIRFKHFSNPLRDFSIYVVSFIHQSVAQKLDKIQIVYIHASFVGILRKLVSKSQAANQLGLKVCWCTLEACKYKRHNNNRPQRLLA